MNAEIVGVGTELLLGQIANTNAQRLSSALAGIGVDVYLHTAVGDNLERMSEVLSAAAGRSDVVIVTGGLGPTPDDITREGICRATGRELVRDEAIAEKIRRAFERMGRDMPEINLRQADLPEGAVAFEPRGTAPGFYLDAGALLIALPGVPWEMDAMLASDVLPLLRSRAGEQVTLSRQIFVIGLGESATYQRIQDIVDTQTNPTIAFLAGGGLVRLRLTTKAKSEAEAIALISPIEDQIRQRLGADAVPGSHAAFVDAVAEILREKELTVATAESLTGGLLGAELTSAGGASDFYSGSLVCYTTEAKEKVAGVDAAILQGPGAVSAEAASALATAAAHQFDANIGLSTTGVAGPAEQEGKPVGTIFVGVAFDGRVETRAARGYGGRDNIRAVAVTAALDLARRMLQGLA